mgnify:CR=1 FL=1
MKEIVLIKINIYGMNNYKIYYISIILLTIIFSSCNSSGMNVLSITNVTSDSIYIDFTKTSNPIDTIVSLSNQKEYRYRISSFEEYNKKTNVKEVERELSKILIFKVTNKDTIYLPLETYNKTEKLVVENDFGYSRFDYYLIITDSMFE